MYAESFWYCPQEEPECITHFTFVDSQSQPKAPLNQLANHICIAFREMYLARLLFTSRLTHVDFLGKLTAGAPRRVSLDLKDDRVACSDGIEWCCLRGVHDEILFET